MPNIKSAIKRVKTSNVHRSQNHSEKSDMRSAVKRVETLVAENNAASAKDALNTAVKKIDKAAQKGLIHKNNASRQKARLTKKVNDLGA